MYGDAVKSTPALTLSPTITVRRDFRATTPTEENGLKTPSTTDDDDDGRAITPNGAKREDELQRAAHRTRSSFVARVVLTARVFPPLNYPPLLRPARTRA